MSKSSRRRARRKAQKTAVRRAPVRAQPAPAAQKARASREHAAPAPPRLGVGAVAIQELTAVLASPVAWIAGAVFVLVVSGLGFFATGVAERQATLTGVFAVIANILVLILAALITAGFSAGARRGGWEVAVGRWLAGVALCVLLLATSLVYVVLFDVYGHGTTLDLGLAVTNYVGLLLLGGTAIAVGLPASVIARNPVAGFLIALAILAAVWYAGYGLGFATVDAFSRVLDYASAYSRYQSFSLGLISLRDVAFFVSVAAAALVVAARLLADRRARLVPVAVAAVVALIGVNVASSSATLTVDATSGALNTLAPPSVLAARQLTRDLDVIGLFRPGAGNGRYEAEALVSLYASESGYLKYRRANWDSDTVDVQRYRVREPNTIVLDYGGKTALLSPRTQLEHDFTSAVLKLESDRVPVVCWVTGQGGRDLSNNNQSSGYSGLGETLAGNDFTVRDLAIGQVTAVPADCDEVALIGATSALPAPSVKALDDYLAAGGRLLIASDPWQDPAITESLSSVLKPYGIGFSGSLVIEPDPSFAFDVITPAVLTYGRSPITANLAGVASFFPQSTSITGIPVPSGVSAIGFTSAASYTIDRARQDLKRQSGDNSGPFLVMETIEQSAGGKTARIAVVGTAAIAENRVLPPNSTDANLDLALGTFQWLAGQDQLATIPAKPRRSPLLILTAQDQSVLIAITVFLMPGLMLAVAAVLWRRRRRVR